MNFVRCDHQILRELLCQPSTSAAAAAEDDMQDESEEDVLDVSEDVDNTAEIVEADSNVMPIEPATDPIDDIVIEEIHPESENIEQVCLHEFLTSSVVYARFQWQTHALFFTHTVRRHCPGGDRAVWRVPKLRRFSYEKSTAKEPLDRDQTQTEKVTTVM